MSLEEQKNREAAIKMLAVRAISAKAMAANIPSPCLSVCRMDTRGALCDGCFRTIEEIAEWSRIGDARKKEIWGNIATRLVQVHATAFDSP